MYTKIYLSIAALLYSAMVWAQSPEMYPPPVPEQVDVTLFNIILYIVLPVALVAAFFWYQRSQKKKRQQRQKKRENETGRKQKR